MADVSAITFGSDLFNKRPDLVTISIQLHPSTDVYHRGLFMDYPVQNASFLGLNKFNPFSIPFYSVLQNEGYIQCYATFSALSSKKTFVFNIPNKSVYNRYAKEIVPPYK